MRDKDRRDVFIFCFQVILLLFSLHSLFFQIKVDIHTFFIFILF